MKITLWGNTPSKKNAKIMVFSKKKIIKRIEEYQNIVNGKPHVFTADVILSNILEVP